MSEEKNKMHGGVGEDNPDAPKRDARKVRFQPKVPARKLPKPAVPKTDVPSEAELAEKLRFANKSLGLRRKPKTEKKSEDMESDLTKKPTSTTIRSFGLRSCSSESSEIKSLDIVPFGGIPSHDSTSMALDEPKKIKQYKEPWNQYSEYPVTLPLRRPYSGDPKILDEEEFGKAGDNKEYDETEINAAAELGLMEESNETNMIFLQLPPSLPASRRSASAMGKEIAGNRRSTTCSLEELRGGFMGKMLVYKSGAVKLKLGDNLFHVFPGSGVCAETVAAIDTKGKRCNVVGDITRRAVLTPDIDSIAPLNSVINLD
ncbi:DNA-directed RNA polymerase III subunit RPC4-like [Papaver somniferum]|uniref:DNA-directed RNA polymerase III subunit RPC4-like n=1 Tax=Papaver somniferum TaxID=3469 RepID=UPI000E6FEB1E|nr:DNA-directed RNA polymerase III subunit RPC4-like [Papaver somniferum]